MKGGVYRMLTFNRTGKRTLKRVDDWLDEQPDG